MISLSQKLRLRLACVCLSLHAALGSTVQAEAGHELWRQQNLMAWCIVPFDAKKRSPVERAAMLRELKFTQLAYDWREEHVPTFDAEVQAMKAAGITISAWWFPGSMSDPHAQGILDVIKRHGIKPQLWVTGGGSAVKAGKQQEQRVAEELVRLRPLAKAAAAVGCSLGLYNHGGWFGDPENQIELVEALRKEGLTNVGLVYNFHHGHEHMARFGALVPRMKPHLLAVNINGMSRSKKPEDKIMPVGSGTDERAMMQVLEQSGWVGPVGILDHRPETDSAQTLAENLAGLRAPSKLADPGPVPFFPDFKPLEPQEAPYHAHFVNRERIYDFYRRQGRAFPNGPNQPSLLKGFPGLDGGRHGHWGNQNEEVWAHNRWNETDQGQWQAAVMRFGQEYATRCVNLRFAGDWNASFDTDTAQWRAVWRGAFLQWDTVRSGLMGHPKPAGKLLDLAGQKDVTQLNASRKGKQVVYHGFLRLKTGPALNFSIDQVRYVEWPVVKDGQMSVVTVPMDEKFIPEFTKLWPAVEGPASQRRTFAHGAAVTEFPPPETPWKTIWHLTGHDFLPTGEVVVCTFEGDVWLVSQTQPGATTKPKWRRVASGLNQALGLKVHDGKIFVLGRDQITRLEDLNGDGESDSYACFSRAYPSPWGGHDYLTGLEQDAQGNWYFASGNPGVVKVSPDGTKATVIATGLRNPNGLAVSENGQVISSAQEGDWVPASSIFAIRENGHYRWGGPKPGALGDLPPMLYLPRGVENSCGGQIFVTPQAAAQGWPAEGLLHLSWGYGRAFLLLRQTVGEHVQGCAVPLPGEFASASHRGRFHPKDGRLWVTGGNGWGSYTPELGCLAAMEPPQATAILPTKVDAHENGILLEFNHPVASQPDDVGRCFAQQWNYRPGPSYGSEEYSLKQPTVVGHDTVRIQKVHQLTPTSIFLEMPSLVASHQLHLQLPWPQLVAEDLYLSPQSLAPSYTQHGVPGKMAATAAAAAPASPLDASGLPPVLASPHEKKPAARPAFREILVKPLPGLLFDQTVIRAKPGEWISLTFENTDVNPHNWLLAAMGKEDEVATAGDRMVADPDAWSRSYVPKLPSILAYTRVVAPGGKSTIYFQVPQALGSYPYLCTFPGHSRVMKGELKVE